MKCQTHGWANPPKTIWDNTNYLKRFLVDEIDTVLSFGYHVDLVKAVRNMYMERTYVHLIPLTLDTIVPPHFN